MRKIIVTLIMITMLFITGCNTSSSSINHETYSDYESNNNTNCETSNNDFFELQDPDGWSVTIEGDVRFVPITKERIHLLNNVYMYTFVDLQTGNTYLYTRELIHQGGASTFTLLTNADGTNCVYEDLESLREFYNYQIN